METTYKKWAEWTRAKWIINLLPFFLWGRVFGARCRSNNERRMGIFDRGNFDILLPHFIPSSIPLSMYSLIDSRKNLGIRWGWNERVKVAAEGGGRQEKQENKEEMKDETDERHEVPLLH